MKISRIVYVVLLAAVSYGALALFSEGVVLPGWDIVLLLSAMTLINYALRSLRWKLLLEHYDMGVSLWEAVRTYLAGLIFIVTPAKAGEVVKAELMNKRHGFDRKQVGFIVVVERAFDILAHLLIGGATALLVATQYVSSFAGILALLVAGAVGLYVFRGKLSFVQEELEKLGDARLITVNVLLSVFSWFFEDLQVFLAVAYFGGQIGLAEAFFAFSASLVFGNLTMLPGGIGAAEASSTGMLIFFGLEKGVATSVTMLTRFTTLWLGFLIGAVFWFWTFHDTTLI